ncbi:MAG: hypothetical protein PHV06_07480 [bacterium]|nr:hypothetical protein [bacterium]
MKKISLIFILILMICFVLSCGKNHEEYKIETEKREACSGNLRDIGNAIYSYELSNNKLPENLEILIEQHHLKSLPVCPISGEAYVYEKKSASYKVLCPNPEKHVGLL